MKRHARRRNSTGKRRLFIPAVRAGTGSLAEPGGLRGRGRIWQLFYSKKCSVISGPPCLPTYFVSLIVAIGLCGYSVLGLCYDNMVLSRGYIFRNTDYCDGFADTADTDLRRRPGWKGWTEFPAQKGVSCRMWNWPMWRARLSAPCLVVGGPDEPAPAHKRNDAWGGKQELILGKAWRMPEA